MYHRDNFTTIQSWRVYVSAAFSTLKIRAWTLIHLSRARLFAEYNICELGYTNRGGAAIKSPSHCGKKNLLLSAVCAYVLRFTATSKSYQRVRTLNIFCERESCFAAQLGFHILRNRAAVVLAMFFSLNDFLSRFQRFFSFYFCHIL